MKPINEDKIEFFAIEQLQLFDEDCIHIGKSVECGKIIKNFLANHFFNRKKMLAWLKLKKDYNLLIENNF